MFSDWNLHLNSDGNLKFLSSIWIQRCPVQNSYIYKLQSLVAFLLHIMLKFMANFSHFIKWFSIYNLKILFIAHTFSFICNVQKWNLFFILMVKFLGMLSCQSLTRLSPYLHSLISMFVCLTQPTPDQFPVS